MWLDDERVRVVPLERVVRPPRRRRRRRRRRGEVLVVVPRVEVDVGLGRRSRRRADRPEVQADARRVDRRWRVGVERVGRVVLDERALRARMHLCPDTPSLRFFKNINDRPTNEMTGKETRTGFLCRQSGDLERLLVRRGRRAAVRLVAAAVREARGLPAVAPSAVLRGVELDALAHRGEAVLPDQRRGHLSFLLGTGGVLRRYSGSMGEKRGAFICPRRGMVVDRGWHSRNECVHVGRDGRARWWSCMFP